MTLRKIPLLYKGPFDHLSRYFSDEQLLEGLELLLNGRLTSWDVQNDNQWIEAQFSQSSDETAPLLTIKCQLNWPLNEELGQCDCNGESMSGCSHLAAMAIEAKTLFDRIPLQKKDIAPSNYQWSFLKKDLANRLFDPYPNMARHRVTYLLLWDNQELVLKLTKSYLTKDGQYVKKANLLIKEMQARLRPKFITEDDQLIFQHLFRVFEFKEGSFYGTSDALDDLLPKLLATHRCFWRSTHGKPLYLTTQPEVPEPSIPLIKHWYFLKPNCLVRIQSKTGSTHLLPKHISEVIPRVTLSSSATVQHDDVLESRHVDILKVDFLLNKTTSVRFDQLNELQLNGLWWLDEIAAQSRQLAGLPSISESQPRWIAAQFDSNDRSFAETFSHTAVILNALFKSHWKIVIDSQFTLARRQLAARNAPRASDWYLNVESSHNQNRQAFKLELGIRVKGKRHSLLPALEQWRNTRRSSSVADFLYNLDSDTPVLLDGQQLQQISELLLEAGHGSASSSDTEIELPFHQIIRIESIKQWMTQLSDAANTDDQVTNTLSLNKKTASAQIWRGNAELYKKAAEIEYDFKHLIVDKPSSLHASLRHYQQDGLNWLAFLFKHGFCGILADDMGLGKTLQTLAFIAFAFEQKKIHHPVLIVVPTSVATNWQQEVRRFTPSLKSLLIQGHQRKRLWEAAKQFHIVIVSYGMFSRDFKHIPDKSFSGLVLDEAQTIKNRRSKITQAVAALNTDWRLCLSGTPVENNLSELWSLFNFLMPGFLGTYSEFKEQFADPIEKEKDTYRQHTFSQRIAPFILRRTKDKVAHDLPPKTNITEWIELGEQQQRVYDSVRQQSVQIIQSLVEQGQHNQRSLMVSQAILRLRQACCHPRLLKLEQDLPDESAKLEWLLEVIPELIETKRQVLIFSQFTSMLDIISGALQEIGVSHLMLTGKTKERATLVEQFQSGQVPVFLISLKAGGVGLNLTAADTVIHFDPWWNPAATEQASDRAYRIGQTKPVFVYHLICKDSVEDNIHQMQLRKRELAENIYQSTQANMSLDPKKWLELLQPPANLPTGQMGDE